MKRLIVLLLLLAVCTAGAEGDTFRALCIGVANYDDGRARVGGYNSTRGVYDALTAAHPGCEARMLFDPVKDEILDGIAEFMADANDDSVTAVYINSHGGALGGISWLESRDGLKITPAELRNAFGDTAGTVLLIIDCCNSGGFIGQGSAPDVFASGILRSFGGGSASGVSVFGSSAFLVCVSCSFDQNSYRIASNTATEESMSTVFSRSLCEALGWDLVNDRPTTYKADTDGDHKVSYTEMCAYTRQRCMYYLSFSSPARQSVQFTPETSLLTIAERNEK